MARIALDAMGGDDAPRQNIEGAIQSGVDVVLVGDEPILRQHLAGSDLPVVHAGEVIDMGADPAKALREKRDSSIAVAARLVAEGEADGLVSAGSTGAAMAAAALIVGRIEGVLRPAIATLIPSGDKGKILLDSGANPDVKPEHLVQFAIMGSALAETRLNISLPRVGLLNIGEEPGKGRELERVAFEALAKAPVNFVGNVEGRDVAGDKADVIVTDGFTGNVALKTSEGTGRLVLSVITAELHSLLAERPELADHLVPRMAKVGDQLDPDSYGGATLLGVQGVVTIAHGSSSARAISSALRMTDEEADRNLIERIRSGLDA